MSLSYKSTDGCAKGATALSKQVISLKQEAEKRRIQDQNVWKQWMESKIDFYLSGAEDCDSITFDLPYIQGHIVAQNDTPYYIQFLREMEDEGEGSDDVFSVSSGDDWFVKKVSIEEKDMYLNGREVATTHFKVTVEKVITHQCMICDEYRVSGCMMSNDYDSYMCEDCHSAFEMM
tara:strand:- start:724 stop:1251 length:528 start_codon:yes stop_codon:yes gene_type:complete